MDTSLLKSFAASARVGLLASVSARAAVVLAQGSLARIESPVVVAELERAVDREGLQSVVDRVAYTWFNRLVALRFMDVNGFSGSGVVSPATGESVGRPEILASALGGVIDSGVVDSSTSKRVLDLLTGTISSDDAQSEAFGLLLAAYCHHWNKAMPFMFEKSSDFVELLMPQHLLAGDSVLAKTVETLSAEVCSDVEVIGWLYQFYIAELKDEVFAGFKKSKKAGAKEIPPATQLFTPHWIVRYLVENSLGRLWLLNYPSSSLASKMEYYIAPVDEETDFLQISSPEELKVVDPACGSGHLLTYAFDLLYEIYLEEGYPEREIPGKILANNLFGVEIDPRAGSLAAFALTMKARQKNSGFFAQEISPQICVLKNVRFTEEELDELVSKGGNRVDEEMFWNAFEHADTFGSLIQPNESLFGAVTTHLALNTETDLVTTEIYERARIVLKQSEYLSQRYNVVVANPPYMGSKNMGPQLHGYLNSTYEKFSGDLFAAFYSRSTYLISSKGLIGLMSPNVWMYNQSHSEMRAEILVKKTLCSLVELPLTGFTEATVQICAFVFINKVNEDDLQAEFLRLVGVKGGASSMAEALKQFILEEIPETKFHRSPSIFKKVPGSPLAYWVDEPFLDIFNTNKQLESIAPVRQGFQTGDNDRFLRFWYEVSTKFVNRNSSSTSEFFASEAHYAPYLKGGALKKWFGNDEYVVKFDRSNFDSLSKMGNNLPSRHLYFLPGVTWSALSSGAFGARLVEVGSTFSAKGAMAFPQSADTNYVLALLNSTVASKFFEFMAATLDFNVGSIRQIPLPRHLNSQELLTINDQVEELLQIHKRDWNEFETSPNFTKPIWSFVENSQLLSSIFQRLRSEAKIQEDRVFYLEGQVNETLELAFGLDISSSEIRDEFSTTLLNNYSQNSELQYSRNLTQNLFSFYVGALLGRFSSDRPGFVLANQGETLADFLALIPEPSFMPDDDNVVPFTEGQWFEDDVVARFYEFLKVAFGEEHFSENVRFIEETLGKDIRKYFLTDFYTDHVKRYKTRPIYWMFSSPQGSFNALIYMHRYNSSTVGTVLKYVQEFVHKLRSQKEVEDRIAVSGTNARDQAQAAKESAKLQKMIVEVSEWERDVLYPLAQKQIEIDLDDGVKENYPKFGKALKQIKGLDKNDE